jgi:aspartokinase/homoserine dehydrogenase 1
MHFIKISGDLLGDVSALRSLVNKTKEFLKAGSCILFISGRQSTQTKLTTIGLNAAHVESNFSRSLEQLEKEYLDLAREVVPVVNQGETLSFIRKNFNDAENLCKGIQLLGECPDKARNLIQSIPALINTQLFFAASKAEKIPCTTNILEQNQESVAILIPDFGNNLHPIFKEQIIVASKLSYMCKELPFVTADPTKVGNAQLIPQLTYDEAIELSRYVHIGLHADLIDWTRKQQIEIELSDIIGNKQLISDSSKMPERGMITGITIAAGYALVSIEGSGMIGVPGFAQRVFAALYKESINISLISQGASEHAICLAVKDNQIDIATTTLEIAFYKEIIDGIIKPIQYQPAVTLVELIGENMRSHPGISGRMFSALGNNGINILAIAQGSNEMNISAVVKQEDSQKALNVLHEAFFEFAYREVNLFMVGAGNVGKKLLDQLSSQFQSLVDKHHIKIVLAGICNSKKMLINAEGIQLDQWKNMLASGKDSNTFQFANEMIRLNLRNSVLVDVTANQDVPALYSMVLKKSMSIVACNKIAASDRYKQYQELKMLALSYNCKFLFETNVGAALPVIGTLNDLMKSGDNIQKIEAVLSGTLNFVFDNYDGSSSFATVVKTAQDEGYTEPDPRLDLSGLDVMRKIIILARETGVAIEMEDISCNGFLPAACMEGSVENFYQSLKANEIHFQHLLDAAKSENAKLKFVATYSNGKASVGLQHIKAESEMYHLYGKDNIVLFYTDRYPIQPLVVKGAGAGADVTASGVFADILRTINR